MPASGDSLNKGEIALRGLVANNQHRCYVVYQGLPPMSIFNVHPYK